MSEFSELIKEQMEGRLTDLHTAITGRITNITGNTANVQPLQGDAPLLINLPMVTQRYRVDVSFDITGGGSYGGETVSDTFDCYGPHYEVGDIVLVIFLERARDGAGDRKHDLSDGVIVGVIA